MALKVIGAGLPRTATTTALVALEQLGFGPVYHMRDMLMNLEGELPKWEAVEDGNADWEAILGDAQSTLDWPAGRRWAELMELYPDAKVFLTVRPADAWLRSMRETVWAVYFGDSMMHYVNAARALVDPLWKRYLTVMTSMLWDEETGALPGDTFDDASFMAIYDRYNDHVKQSVPAERLLVWDPADGWEPLCTFLEVDVPDGPVPRLNDTQSFKEGVMGGAIGIINQWWGARERPATGLHGAEID